MDGVRQDSGNPVEFGDKIIRHYRNLKIDPKTRRIIFSDSLDFQKALALYHTFNPEIDTYFGIGTNLSNDAGFKPLNIVIKMIECNGKPVAKLSDDAGKETCMDPYYLSNLKHRIKNYG